MKKTLFSGDHDWYLLRDREDKIKRDYTLGSDERKSALADLANYVSEHYTGERADEFIKEHCDDWA